MNRMLLLLLGLLTIASTSALAQPQSGGSSPSPVFTGINVSGTTGYSQYGVPLITQTNGVGSPDVCTVNCTLLVGTGAGVHLGNAEYLGTFVGWGAGGNMTSGSSGNPGASESTCLGYKCLYAITTGSMNTAIGINALGTNANGAGTNGHDILIGTDAMRQAYATANYDVGIGVSALFQSGDKNTIAIGESACPGNSTMATTGSDNVCIGFGAMAGTFSSGTGGSETSASHDILVGTFAGRGLTSGSNNVMIGHQAGILETVASGEVIIGQQAAAALTSVGNNVLIGNGAALASTLLNASIVIGPLAGSGTNHLGSHNVIIGTGSAVDTVNLANAVTIENVFTGTGPYATHPTTCSIGQTCIIGSLYAANFNSTADQAIVIAPRTSSVAGYLPSATKYIVTGVWADNCSGANGTTAGGVYDAASKGGNALVAAAQTWANCASAGTMQTATMAAISQSVVETAATLYLSLTTTHGSAETGDVYVLGIPFN